MNKICLISFVTILALSLKARDLVASEADGQKEVFLEGGESTRIIARDLDINVVCKKSSRKSARQYLCVPSTNGKGTGVVHLMMLEDKAGGGTSITQIPGLYYSVFACERAKPSSD